MEYVIQTVVPASIWNMADLYLSIFCLSTFCNNLVYALVPLISKTLVIASIQGFCSLLGIYLHYHLGNKKKKHLNGQPLTTNLVPPRKSDKDSANESFLRSWTLDHCNSDHSSLAANPLGPKSWKTQLKWKFFLLTNEEMIPKATLAPTSRPIQWK